MDQKDRKIKRFLSEGHSLHATAEKINISYGACRRRAVKHGFHVPKNKKVKNGRAVCLRCGQNLPVKNFPRLQTDGQYVCADCYVDDLHKYQIKRVGCTEEKYQQLSVSQQGKCAICGTSRGHQTKRGRNAKLAVDHDHETGEIRGLLCNSCNRGLGFLGEENLAAALKYVKENFLVEA